MLPFPAHPSKEASSVTQRQCVLRVSPTSDSKVLTFLLLRGAFSDLQWIAATFKWGNSNGRAFHILSIHKVPAIALVLTQYTYAHML